MELTVEHRFPAPLARVIDTLVCPAYGAHLAASHSFFASIETLELRGTAQNWQRRVAYRARPFIARLGVFSLPAEWFAWEERSSFAWARGELTFENVPHVRSVRDKVINRGRMRFVELAGEEGLVETVREASFEVEFKVATMYRPLADMALSMVRRQLEGSLDEEAALLSGWLGRAGEGVAA